MLKRWVMTGRRLVVGLVSTWLLLVFLLPPSLAHADSKRIQDAQDALGAMDLRWADHGHGDSPRLLIHKISTYDPWNSEDLVIASVAIWLRDGDSDIDRVVWVRNRGGSTVGSVCAGGSEGECGNKLGPAKVYRSGSRTLVIEFKHALLEDDLPSYRWKVFLYSNGEPPPPPDTHPGRVLHRL